jgi:competence protein ComEA
LSDGLPHEISAQYLHTKANQRHGALSKQPLNRRKIMNFIARTFTATALVLLALAPNAFAGKPVNINTATAAELADSLEGIGQTKAQAIVAYRTQNGGFKSADQLAEVKGIGLKTVEKNASFIQLGGAPAAAVKK